MNNQNSPVCFKASPLKLRGPFRIRADLDVHMDAMGRFNIEDCNTKTILGAISSRAIDIGIEYIGAYTHAEYCTDVWLHGTEKHLRKFLDQHLCEVESLELEPYEKPEIDLENFRTPDLDKAEQRRIDLNLEMETHLVTDSFNSHGAAIHNPYFDESGTEEISPEHYYGQSYAEWYLMGDGHLSVLPEEDEDDLEEDDEDDDDIDDEADGEILHYEYDDQKKERHILNGKILIAVGTVMTSRGISLNEAIDGGVGVDNEIVERLMENGVDQEKAKSLVFKQDVFTWLRKLN